MEEIKEGKPRRPKGAAGPGRRTNGRARLDNRGGGASAGKKKISSKKGPLTPGSLEILPGGRPNGSRKIDDYAQREAGAKKKVLHLRRTAQGRNRKKVA